MVTTIIAEASITITVTAAVVIATVKPQLCFHPISSFTSFGLHFHPSQPLSSKSCFTDPPVVVRVVLPSSQPSCCPSLQVSSSQPDAWPAPSSSHDGTLAQI